MTWDTFFDIILDALKDSAIIFPFLLIAYVIIEILEVYSAKNIQQNRLLTGKTSTLFAASFGLVPQCGFSVVATDLFAQKKVKLGVLLAVYISTSDEAFPLLLTSAENTRKMLAIIPLMLIKFVLGVVVGYTVDTIIARQNQKRIAFTTDTSENKSMPLADNSVVIDKNNNEEELSGGKEDGHTDHDHNEDLHHHGCCGHDIEGEKVNQWKQFLLHPLIHSLKIFAFILAVNFVMGLIIGFVGEDSLSNALTSSKWFAPLIACLIGAIPNCASSVVITRLYILGGIGFGALTAGLIVNAGIGFVILFKQNKNIKQNFAILGGMLLLGITAGYIIQLIGF